MTERHDPASDDPVALPGPHGGIANEADLYHAFRLLLGREPDARGWRELCRSIAEHPLSPSELARGFIESAEFAARADRPVMAADGAIEVRLDGFSVFVPADDRDIGRGIRDIGEYEPHVTAAVRELLKPGHVFVDVGANVGFFTNLAARIVEPSGLVVAIEALDKNVQLILRALEANGFDHVRVNTCAASDREGRVRMVTDAGTSNGQALGKGGTSTARVLYAQARRIDDLTRDLPRIDLVKFDIEGYEPFAWRGFEEGLARYRPNVLTEFHPYCMRKYTGASPEAYLDTLFDYADAVQVLTPRGKRLACRTPADVMRQWEAANEAAGTDGTYHLDLLVRTDG